MKVYHGTSADFDAHKSSKFESAGYFAEDPSLASLNTGWMSEPRGQNVRPSYLRIENPLDLRHLAGDQRISADEFMRRLPIDIPESLQESLRNIYKTDNYPWGFLGNRDLIRLLKSKGFDGIVYHEGSPEFFKNVSREAPVRDATAYIAFDPSQIKSAIGNNGDYSPNESSVLKSVAPKLDEAKLKALAEIGASHIGNNGNFNPEDPSILKAKRTITRRILNRIDKTLASQDISTTRALENIVNKNLQQLKKVDEDAFEQVVKLATTEAQATIEALQTGQRDPAILDAIRKRNYDDVKVTLTVAGVAQKYTAGMTHSGTLHGQPSTLVRIGDEQFVVQSWLARELKAVLDKPHDANVLQRFVDKLDSFGMAGPLDLFFHGTNVIATLIGGTPYVGTDVLSRTVGNTPVTKWITTLVQLWRSDPEALLQNDPQMLRDMADAGVIPQGYASETYAKRFAGTSELKSPLPFHRGLAPDLGPMLRGPKGLDIRSRILLWKVGKHMNPDATATEMHDFVNQLGIYNQKLQSQLVRFLQQSRLGKFSVAGTTMTKNGILAWLNKNPLPIEDLPLADRTWIRAQQQFSGGLLGIGLILWVALSKLYRGVFPWNDEKSQLLRIPLNDKDRHSWLVERIYGPEGDVFVNLAFLSPLLARGADALGISGAYNTGVLGGNKTQMAENAATGMINAAIHPVSTSPTTKAVFEGLTGNEMHVRGLRDKQGQAGMDLWPLDLPKGSGAGRRALEGALDLNPFIGNIIHSFGVNRSEKHPNLLTDSENRILLESLMEYTAPRLIKKTDVGKKRGFIQEQKRSMH